MEVLGEKLQNSPGVPALVEPSENNRRSLEENNIIHTYINQKRKLPLSNKVRKRFKNSEQFAVKRHQQFEVYEVAENGELIKESSENQLLIDSAENQYNNQPKKSVQESNVNEKLEDTPEILQSKRKYIFEKCFSIVHKENTKIQAKCMLCETGKNKFIKGDERSVSNFVSHLKIKKLFICYY